MLGIELFWVGYGMGWGAGLIMPFSGNCVGLRVPFELPQALYKMLASAFKLEGNRPQA